MYTSFPKFKGFYYVTFANQHFYQFQMGLTFAKELKHLSRGSNFEKMRKNCKSFFPQNFLLLKHVWRKKNMFFFKSFDVMTLHCLVLNLVPCTYDLPASFENFVKVDRKSGTRDPRPGTP